MKKKIIEIFVCILLITIVLPTAGTEFTRKSSVPSLLDGNILYVGGSGPGNYTRIQDAIDNASDGDTVFVYNGTYYENLDVDKSINLIGEDKETTVIDGNTNGEVVYISIDWVNISNFTIKNSSTSSAEIKIISDHCTISNNNFGPENHGYGVFLEDANYNVIFGNYFSKIYLSIILWDSENNNISDNSIECGDNDGIKLMEHSHSNYISDNYITGKSSTFALIDIDRECNNTIVTYNTLSKGVYGIYTYVNWETNITGNIIGNCENYGITLAGGWGELGGRHIAYGNWIKNCGGRGIYCRETIFNNISHNSISSNTFDGIWLYETNDNTISNNAIGSNGRHGLYFYQSSPDNIIFNNNINLNNGHGIYIEESSPNITINDNTINSNEGHGLYINGSSSNNNIYNNNICFNNGYGIRLENYSSPSNNNIIYHNNFINNAFNGYDNCENNTWDDGYPSGGNYWSDYNGTDKYRGVNQDIPGYDGIGDTPKKVYGFKSDDYYPLMHPWYKQQPVANYTYLIIGDGGLLFNGSSSYDRDGEILLYEWDFDDGSTAQGMDIIHAYNESGTYNVTLTVTDNDDYKGSYSIFIDAEKNNPPSTPSIDGPVEEKALKSHLYDFTSEDPELADVSYYIEWGDGAIEDWSDFQPSSEPYSNTHGWAKGNYTIRCKAKDIYGAESGWGTLKVTMPKYVWFLNWLDNFPLLQRLLMWLLGQ